MSRADARLEVQYMLAFVHTQSSWQINLLQNTKRLAIFLQARCRDEALRYSDGICIPRKTAEL